MSIIILLFLIAVICSIRKPFRYNSEYLSIKHTHMVNGIFIVLVFLRHFWQYVDQSAPYDTAFDAVNSFLGQTIVTSFMFYSGYGVTASIQKKGKSYLDSFPLNRILKTMVLFDIAIVFYLILSLILREAVTVPRVLLSFVGIKDLGNSSWYIFAILCMYLVSWISFRCFVNYQCKYRNEIILGTQVFLTLVYMIISRQFFPGQYYNTVLCYPLGAFWYLYREKIDRLLQKDLLRYGGTVLLGILYVTAHHFRHVIILIDQMQFIFFILFFVLLTASFTLQSRVFQWMGENLLGLYILQRLPMIILDRAGFLDAHTYISFAVCAAVTVVLAYGYSALVMKNVNRLFTIQKKGNVK